MKYKPQEEQAPQTKEPGEYDFTVVESYEDTSKLGNPLIRLSIQIDDGPTIKDNLVFTEKAFWKIDAFRRAVGDEPKVGQEEDIEPGSFVGKRGRAMFEHEWSEAKNRNYLKVGYYMTQPEDDNKPF